MNFETTTNARHQGSLPLLAFGIIISVICIGEWVRSDQVGHLVCGIGFLFMSPGWYHIRPQLNKSLADQRKYIRPQSRVCAVLTFIGFALLLLGVALRWVP
jgi:heme A synthase